MNVEYVSKLDTEPVLYKDIKPTVCFKFVDNPDGYLKIRSDEGHLNVGNGLHHGFRVHNNKPVILYEAKIIAAVKK